MTARRRLEIAGLLVMVLVPATARARRLHPRGPCSVIAVGDKQGVAAGISKRGPYSEALRSYRKGHFRRAARAFDKAASRQLRILSRAMRKPGCDEDAIHKAISRTVLTRPSAVVPAEDRFVVPSPVVLIWATSLCRSGDTEAAARLLARAALAGDDRAGVMAAVLYAWLGKRDLAQALLHENQDEAAAVATWFVKGGRSDWQKEMAHRRAQDPLVAAIMRLAEKLRRKEGEAQTSSDP